MDDSGSDTDDGFSPDEIDDCNDGDDDPHEQDCIDVTDDIGASYVDGDTAGNTRSMSHVAPVISLPTLGGPAGEQDLQRLH